MQREHQPLVRDHRGPVLLPVSVLTRAEAVVLDERVGRASCGSAATAESSAVASITTHVQKFSPWT
jgi:hypothetical protein